MSSTRLEHDLGTERPGGSSLPTPSTLITSLISSLPSAPSPSPSTATNPLHNAPPPLRSLLTTLHIFFPSLLLPALDLLDRHLITKLILLEIPPSQTQQAASSPSADSPRVAPETGGTTVAEPRAVPAPTNTHVSGEKAQDAGHAQHGAHTTHEQNVLYLVRSSQSSRSRSHAEKYYTVRLHAWNCSCAAFVFAAFPGNLSSATATERWKADLPFHGNGHFGEDEAEDEERWNFGGLRTDGRDGGAVPCCKHLLACVLADRCAGWLGGFVKERMVGREEMAGLACEG